MRRILSLVAGAVQGKSAVFLRRVRHNCFEILFVECQMAWPSPLVPDRHQVACLQFYQKHGTPCNLGKRRRQGKHDHGLIVFLFDIAGVAADFAENEVYQILRSEAAFASHL